MILISILRIKMTAAINLQLLIWMRVHTYLPTYQLARKSSICITYLQLMHIYLPIYLLLQIKTKNCKNIFEMIFNGLLIWQTRKMNGINNMTNCNINCSQSLFHSYLSFVLFLPTHYFDHLPLLISSQVNSFTYHIKVDSNVEMQIMNYI